MTMLTVTLCLTLCLAVRASSATVERITLTQPRWVPPLIRRLAVCETRGNTSHHAGSYEGIVGWYTGTWQLDKPAGFPAHAYQATLKQQVVVAMRSVARGRYFGCLHGAEHAWVRGT